MNVQRCAAAARATSKGRMHLFVLSVPLIHRLFFSPLDSGSSFFCLFVCAGMYGLMLIQPEYDTLPPVDREYYVMQVREKKKKTLRAHSDCTLGIESSAAAACVQQLNFFLFLLF